MPANVQGSSGMSGAASQLLHLQWRAAVLPVNILLSWTQYTTAAIVHTFMALGLFPQGSSSQKSHRDALSTVDQMSRREQVYRKRIEELEGESESHLRDKRKALLKLQKARAELAGLPDSNGAPELNPSPEIEEALEAIPDDWSLHASFAVACLSVLWFWCQADTPSLSRKLASAIFFPEVVAYVMGAILQGSSNLRLSSRTAIHCGCWFLSGFIFSHWLLSHT